MRESRLWFWHILSGIVIVFLLGAHMGTMHMNTILNSLGLGSADPVGSAEVFRRSASPVFLVAYIVLLGSALFHGLYGLRSMLFELSLSKSVERTIGGLCTVAGFALFGYGTYVAIAVYRMHGVQP